jgi:hypothetical protein
LVRVLCVAKAPSFQKDYITKYMSNQVRKLGFISSSLPKKCGIATFSRDLMSGIHQNDPKIDFSIAAAEDVIDNYHYNKDVVSVLKTNQKSSYSVAAKRFDALGINGVLLQHEYGLYGGNRSKFVVNGTVHDDPTGDYIFTILNASQYR